MKVTKEPNNKENLKFVGAGPVSAHTSKARQNRGITLIALIITIIVMLILVAVTINMAVNGGLFEKAGKAVGETQNAVNQEKKITNGTIQIDGVWYNSIDEYINRGEESIDWEAILADAILNPDKYKHKDQRSTNGDIGIGTDGKPVNLDLWTYQVIDENEITLNGSGCGLVPGYQNSNIVDGKIIGKVPQYIKINGNNEFYPITGMNGTFARCTNLTTAPEIPSGVTSMNGTFTRCTNLTTAPEIPSSVRDMTSTFSGCTKLQGTIEINANPSRYFSCFLDAATEGPGLVVTGSSTMLDTLIGTKSSSSNITKGT